VAHRGRRSNADPRSARALRTPDPRVLATQLAAPFASPTTNHTYPIGSWAIQTDMVKLPDGTVCSFHPPELVSFNLLEANAHALRGERLRSAAMKQVRTESTGSDRPTNATAVLDAISALSSAVFLAFSAVEGLANQSIGELDDIFTLTVPRHGLDVVCEKASLTRRLSVSEKLGRIIPAVTGRPSALGSRAWQDFVELRRPRDSLVHVRPVASGSFLANYLIT
jgi:hypothetical protein